MIDPFSDRYWIEEFQITEADLNRIADHIREAVQAHDLTALARRVVRGRLRYGPETSAPARSTWAEDPAVRLWDPAGDWEEGDHAIVAAGFAVEGHTVREPFVGEVTTVLPDKIKLQIDTLDEPRTYSVQPEDSEQLRKWRQLVEDLVAARRGTKDVETRTEYVILKHGERVVSQLLEALRTDDRFVRLAGRWFLHELVSPPTEEQLVALAWGMVLLEEPQSPVDLTSLAQPSLAGGDPGLFGLYLAMRHHPDLFENVDPGRRPRWVLAGPPPGSFTPRHAAYDAETYEVLCLPDQVASSKVVRRLWDLNLLQAVA